MYKLFIYMRFIVVYVNSYGCIIGWILLLGLILVFLWMNEIIIVEWCG